MKASFTLTVGGATIAGEHAGTGPAVVFLHAGIADRRMWAAQLTAFSQHFHAVAYDRRGFGQTTSPDEPYSNVDDLRSVIDTLQLPNPVLVGCSQGGRVAIDYALEYPDAVAGLVLVATAVSGAPKPIMPEAVKRALGELETAERSGDSARVNQIETHLWLDGPTSEVLRVSGPARELVLDMNAIALSKPPMTRELVPSPAFERVSDINVPVLLIRGDLDFPHIQQLNAHLANRIRGARAVVIANTAHLPNLEHVDRFNALVAGFCQGALSPHVR